MRSVYVHIPFCNSICSYCDFCKFLYSNPWAEKYIETLKSEILEYYEGEIVKTLYIGGGTPSSLNSDLLGKLFNVLRIFKLSDDYEFTFECNINDINEELLYILKSHGVNRISVGVESFNKNNLKFLNRKHNRKDIFDKIKLAKSYGFDNINVDIIYALPIESMFVLKSDISNILKLDVEHVSTYSLIIEEHTALYNKGIKPIDENLDFKMYKYICKKLQRNGYEHYEVSNFARNGKMSKHNLTYWNNQEYYGFGLGASGYINNMRYENTRSFNKYLNKKYRFNELLVSNQEEMENELILGFRKLKGVSISEFEKKYNKKIDDVFKLDDAIKKKYLIIKDDYLFVNPSKIYVMNEIINMIM